MVAASVEAEVVHARRIEVDSRNAAQEAIIVAQRAETALQEARQIAAASHAEMQRVSQEAAADLQTRDLQLLECGREREALRTEAARLDVRVAELLAAAVTSDSVLSDKDRALKLLAEELAEVSAAATGAASAAALREAVLAEALSQAHGAGGELLMQPTLESLQTEEKLASTEAKLAATSLELAALRDECTALVAREAETSSILAALNQREVSRSAVVSAEKGAAVAALQAMRQAMERALGSAGVAHILAAEAAPSTVEDVLTLWIAESSSREAALIQRCSDLEGTAHTASAALSISIQQATALADSAACVGAMLYSAQTDLVAVRCELSTLTDHEASAAEARARCEALAAQLLATSTELDRVRSALRFMEPGGEMESDDEAYPIPPTMDRDAALPTEPRWWHAAREELEECSRVAREALAATLHVAGQEEEQTAVAAAGGSTLLAAFSAVAAQSPGRDAGDVGTVALVNELQPGACLNAVRRLASRLASVAAALDERDSRLAAAARAAFEQADDLLRTHAENAELHSISDALVGRVGHMRHAALDPEGLDAAQLQSELAGARRVAQEARMAAVEAQAAAAGLEAQLQQARGDVAEMRTTLALRGSGPPPTSVEAGRRVDVRLAAEVAAVGTEAAHLRSALAAAEKQLEQARAEASTLRAATLATDELRAQAQALMPALLEASAAMDALRASEAAAVKEVAALRLGPRKTAGQ